MEIFNQKLMGLNPLETLKRGYAKVESGGKVVDSKLLLKKDQNIDVVFADGKVNAVVKEVE